MWMMGRSSYKELDNMRDRSLKADDHDQNLGPVRIPKPSSSSSSTTAASNVTKNPNITTWSSTTPPCPNMLPFNVNYHRHRNKIVHHVKSTIHEEGSSGTVNMDVKDHPQDKMLLPLRSSRWSPTPEQLLALEELYKRGIKTPTAQQIRQVTEVLRQFGKIEGKNVFYWFQNHRARERQKRRRQEHLNNIMSQSQSSHSNHKQSLHNDQSSSLQNKESATGSTRTSLEVEQEKNWTPLSNCVSLLQQEPASILQRAAMEERRTPGWIHYAEREVQQRMINTLVILNSHFPPPTSHVNTLCPDASYASTYLDTKALLDYNHFTLNNREVAYDDQNRETSRQTLELFPLQSDNLKGVN